MIKNKIICLLIAMGELIMSLRSHIRGDTNWEIAHWFATGLFLSVMFIIMSINGEELLIKSQTQASPSAQSPNSKFTESKNSPKVCSKCESILITNVEVKRGYCDSCLEEFNRKPS